MMRLLPLGLVLLATGCASGERVAAPPMLDVVTLNIWHDAGDWPARLEILADTLAELRPDVIVIQEVLQDSAKALPNQAETLGARLGYAVVFASVNGQEQPKRYGNAILTRHAVLDTSWVRLLPLTDYRVAAHARVDVAGRVVDIYATHFHHTAEGDTIRAAQTADLLAFVERTRGAGAVVVAGDFNAPAEAPELAPLAALYTDAFGALHPDDEPSTLVENLGHTPRRIDHVFAGRRLRPVAARIVLAEPVGGVWPSDHRGVWARLQWE